MDFLGTRTAVNWAEPDDSFTEMFLLQNVKQMWLPEEIALQADKLVWDGLTHQERDTYMKVLGGLDLLDTEQGNMGMPLIASKMVSHQRRTLLMFMAAVETTVHARSYSNIFLTLASTREINEVFSWVETQSNLQEKAKTILKIYTRLENEHSTERDLWEAMVASVYLESFLFYSGFYYPLYMYGNGKMMQSGEIINLIIRDEAIHGAYVGLLAQEIYNRQTENEQKDMKEFAHSLLDTLYKNECFYTEELYDPIGLTHDVKEFVKYNGNKALNNLGFESYFYPEPKINQVVLNGLETKTKSHDFFSMKGNGYKKATVEAIRTSDFIFD